MNILLSPCSLWFQLTTNKGTIGKDCVTASEYYGVTVFFPPFWSVLMNESA